MIKEILAFLFKADIAAIKKEAAKDAVFEARQLLNLAKRQAKQIYVKYDKIEKDSEEFLYGIYPVLNNKYFLSWVNDHKHNCISLMYEAMRVGEKEKVCEICAQMMLIDSLLKDKETFEADYIELVEGAKVEQKIQAE